MTMRDWLEAICESPDDLDLRLVAADWIEENVSHDRALFIRLQIQVRQHEPYMHNRCACDDCRAANSKVAQLQRNHEEEWLAAECIIPGGIPKRIGTWRCGFLEMRQDPRPQDPKEAARQEQHEKADRLRRAILLANPPGSPGRRRAIRAAREAYNLLVNS